MRFTHITSKTAYNSLSFSKHPVLYGVFIPDKSSREVIYINKNIFTIGRNRLSDYVV